MLNLMLILIFQSLLLQIGQSMLEQESLEVERRKISYMEEKCPPLNFPQSMPELQVILVSFLRVTLTNRMLITHITVNVSRQGGQIE
jgi:hypothetical protein